MTSGQDDSRSADITAKAKRAAVGQVWAYRARAVDPLVPVRVLKLGVRRPPRLLVRFMEDEFEGREDWVSPARLKCRWEDVAAFRAREARWDAAGSVSPPQDDPTESAASAVFDQLISPLIATVEYGAAAGVTRIHRLDDLADFLDVDTQWLSGDPHSFEEDGDLIVPWPVTEQIAARAASREPHAVLRQVEHEEAQARREAIYGKSYPSRRGEDRHISAEVCAEVDEQHGRPVRDILRGWCGQEPVDVRREIAELRRETARTSALADAALRSLRGAGLKREAARLEREYLSDRSAAGRDASHPRAGRSLPHRQ